jgi:hypothetical protein
LAAVEKGAEGNLGRGAGNVDVWKDDTRVVATELEPLVRRNGTATDVRPTSRVTRFSVFAAACIILLPVAMEPVNETLWMSG